MSEPSTSTAPQPTAHPSDRWRIAGIAGGVAVLLVGLFFLIRALTGNLSSDVGIKAKPSEETPPFDFALVKVKPIWTAPKITDFESEAHGAGHIIQNELGRLYQLSFLDPKNWKSGKYDKTYGFFVEGQPRNAAMKAARTLTLGNAGGLYDKVLPAGGTLAVRVLMSLQGHPFTAVAIAKFNARAMQKNGGVTLIHTKAQYFMQAVEKGGWAIYGFRMKRSQEHVATGSSSGGGA